MWNVVFRHRLRQAHKNGRSCPRCAGYLLIEADLDMACINCGYREVKATSHISDNTVEMLALYSNVYEIKHTFVRTRR